MTVPSFPGASADDRAFKYPDGVRGSIAKISDYFSSRAAAGTTLPCGKTLNDLDCKGLADQQADYASAQDRAAIASAVYSPPDEQVLPEGWSHATDEDLRTLGLIDSKGGDMTRIPGSDFKSEVFKDPAGKYVIAFKGTTPTSKEDWINNFAQARGEDHFMKQDAEYYSQAIQIAKTATENARGNIEFVGHSLGGGLASAASAATGAPATTFNAAGLNPATVPSYTGKLGDVPAKAYYVKGDILSDVQDKSFGAAYGAAGTKLPLSPAGSVSRGAVDLAAGSIGALAGGPIGAIVGASAARGIQLHLMNAVNSALQKQRDSLSALQRLKGCG